MEADFLIPVLWEWLEFAVRWLHVITAISWIGTSFYFIALDLGLRKISAYEDGIAGEEWQFMVVDFIILENIPLHLPTYLSI